MLHNALIYSDKKQFVELNIALNDPEALLFTVKDNGIGIPPEDMTLIFEPFYRASNSRFVKGSGLGLAIARKIVILHNGRIEITNGPDQMIQTTVWLPRNRYAEQA